ncbi:MAG: zinc ribbon domain-containing protein [Armatimonadetes bacterium]|nr:zinc ribbon domain-containing protein [Armatimonadota bacterium]
MMTIREGRWDCPSCGSKGNRGPEKFCGGCGSPRGDDVQFYLPEDARVVTDEAEVRKAESGPDWKCGACGGDNSSDNNFCTGCGNPREGAKTRQAIERRDAAPEPLKPSKPPKKSFAPVALAGLILFLLGVGLLCLPRSASLTVTGFSWERTIAVERFATITESAWEGEVPSDGRIQSRSREVHHEEDVQTGTRSVTRTVRQKVQAGTQKVKVGTKDMGNGYFKDIIEERPVYKEVEKEETHQEPVYKKVPVHKTKYTYLVDRWQEARKEREFGNDQSARWPAIDLRRGEREGKRSEKYQVLLANAKGKTFTYEPASEGEWKTFSSGGHYKAKLDAFGKIKKIEG